MKKLKIMITVFILVTTGCIAAMLQSSLLWRYKAETKTDIAYWQIPGLTKENFVLGVAIVLTIFVIYLFELLFRILIKEKK